MLTITIKANVPAADPAGRAQAALNETKEVNNETH